MTNAFEQQVTRQLGSKIALNINSLRFQVYRSGTGKKHAICLHGYPEHPLSWRNQIATLTQSGYTVWVPHLRGYASSSRPMQITAYSLGQLLNDVKQLQNQIGAERVLLLGHDWGGVLAWYYSLLYSERVSALAVYDAPHPLLAMKSTTNPRQCSRWLYIPWLCSPGAAQMWLYSPGPKPVCFEDPKVGMSPEVRAVYRSAIREPGALDAMTHWYRALMAGLDIDWVKNPQIHKLLGLPTMVQFGARDHVLDPSLHQGLAQLVPNARIISIPNGGHWSNQETPEMSNAHLTHWLDSLRRAV